MAEAYDRVRSPRWRSPLRCGTELLANVKARRLRHKSPFTGNDIMAAFFTVLTLMAGIWSIVAYFRVYHAVREHLPPAFQDDESSRYAFSVWALQHPTPLSVQAEYVRFVKGSNVAVLCGALALLSFNQIILGCLVLAAFFYSVFLTVRFSRIYAQNCARVPTEANDE